MVSREMDEMVNVQQKSLIRMPVPPAVLRIIYEAPEDLANLLPRCSSSESMLPIHPNPPASSVIHLHRSDHPAQSTQIFVDRPAGRPEFDASQLPTTDAEDTTGSLTDNRDVVPDSYSEEQIGALTKIQHACRSFLRRKNPTQKGNIFAKRDRVFDMYLDASTKMVWSARSRYRLLFLGPLAHIFLCLEWIIDYASKEKKTAKKAVLTTKNQELETVMAKIGRTT